MAIIDDLDRLAAEAADPNGPALVRGEVAALLALAAEHLRENQTTLARARTLIALVTVGQVMDAGNRAILAAGLSPWCVNEGRAQREDKLGVPYWIED